MARAQRTADRRTQDLTTNLVYRQLHEQQPAT